MKISVNGKRTSKLLGIFKMSVLPCSGRAGVYCMFKSFGNFIFTFCLLRYWGGVKIVNLGWGDVKLVWVGGGK